MLFNYLEDLNTLYIIKVYDTLDEINIMNFFHYFEVNCLFEFMFHYIFQMQFKE